MSLAATIEDLRWHVANVQHRHFAITTDYDHDPGDAVFVITCCTSPRDCEFMRRITESELADAGRPDLTDKFAIGALVESIKREAPREAPRAWAKVGELDIGEDDPV